MIKFLPLPSLVRKCNHLFQFSNVFSEGTFFILEYFIASFFKTLCCALRDQMEKSISKSTPET